MMDGIKGRECDTYGSEGGCTQDSGVMLRRKNKGEDVQIIPKYN
jgi:hypothetical protein